MATVLSPREAEVARLVAEGLSNVGIAERLGVHEGTVEKHLTSAFDKLGLGGRESNRRVELALVMLQERRR